MKSNSLYKALIVLISLVSCLEPFDPKLSDSNKDFFIVDGIITDQEGPYTVKISKSSSLVVKNKPVSNIDVKIEDEDGNIESLWESSPGVYQTVSLQGQVNKSYRLILNNGSKQYLSTWERIPHSSIIDSIYYRVEDKATTDKEDNLTGVQFFIDSHGSSESTKYYRYEWEEVWKIGVYWASYYDYLGDDRIKSTENPRYTCWKYENPSSINIATTEGLKENVLSRHLLGFITGEKERFTQRYSLSVKQFALEEKEYKFWKNLQESNEEIGGLFDRQPAKVLSNLSNPSDPNDEILGYFSASGLREKRVYVNSTEVPRELFRRPQCFALDTLTKDSLGSVYEIAIFDQLKNGKFFYDLLFSAVSPIPYGVLLSKPSCSDCTKKGGVLDKPNFWDE